MAQDHSSRVSRRTLLKGAAGATPVVAGALAVPSRLLAAPRGPASSHMVASQEDEPVYGGTLTYGSSKPPVNVINPLNTVGTGQNVLIEALFLRLVYGREWGDGMSPQNEGPFDLAVAETMTEIETDRVWEFELRQNVLWHDGQPVTADDVIYGIWLSLNRDAGTTNETPVVGIKGGDRLREEGGGSVTPPYTVEVEGATKLGDYAVRIELDEAIPNYWINWNVGYWPMPMHIFGEMPLENLFDEPYATMPIGNGPFKAVRYVDEQYMEMEANEDFYLGRPYVDRYIVRFGDGDTLTAALEAQEIDGTGLSAGPVYDRLDSLPHIVGTAVPRNHPDGFVVNFERFPEEAATLHKAIQHAIDVQTLSEQLYSDTLRPSNSLFEHIVGYEEPPSGFETRSYDPEQARAILEEIGWDTNRTLEWMMWSSPGPVQDAMQAMLADAGIRTEYRIIDVATVIDELYREGNYDIVFANFAEAQHLRDVWRYIRCGWEYDEGGFNYARYCNEEVDALWEQVLAETDQATRHEQVEQLSLLLNEAPPQATLYRQSILYGWNTRVRGAHPYQYRLPVRPALEKVWIAPE